MKKFLPFLLLLAICLPGLSLAAPPDLLDAVNKAGYQRMLSQRIVKAYCQTGLGVMPTESREQLTVSVKLFEKRLDELKPATRTSPLFRENLSQLRLLWKGFKQIAIAPPTREGAQRLLDLDDDLLHAAEKLTIHLQDAAGTPYSRLVNLSGRQRMLSQRITKYYMLRAWDIRSARIDEELEVATIEFDAALRLLSAAPENTPEILSELDAVDQQWLWFQASLAMEGAQSYRLVIADASESILKRMDRITRLYENNARR